jgi:hypothetical protein
MINQTHALGAASTKSQYPAETKPTVVNEINTKLYDLNARAESLLERFSNFFSRAGMGEPSGQNEKGHAVSAMGFLSTGQAIEALTDRMSALEYQVNRLEKIA